MISFLTKFNTCIFFNFCLLRKHICTPKKLYMFTSFNFIFSSIVDTIATPNTSMYLNKGQDDEMEIWGYKRCRFKLALMYFFMIITVGFLRLIFHWVPHWYLKATCVQCPINLAQFVLIKVCLHNLYACSKIHVHV